MNRIEQLFEDKKHNILSIFFTAGYPQLNDTVKLIESLEKAGADMIEIGMPFSDPLADGPVIQHASEVALKNGMSLKLLFEQLKEIRKSVNIPLLLMGYLNPIFRYGIDNFVNKCVEIGIDGVILPDLPLAEYEKNYKILFENAGIFNIFLITPQTSDERILKIDQLSKGFIYMVSSASTTGAKKQIQTLQHDYFRRVENLKLSSPRLIGFGISNNKTFRTACSFANGAIIGSAFVSAIQKNKVDEKTISSFIQNVLNGN